MNLTNNNKGPTDDPTLVRDFVARTADDNYSFRNKVRAGAILLLIINVAVGLFARQQQHQIIDYAINVYDTAFISTNYIHLAQISFQHFVDDRLIASTRDERQQANDGLANVLDNLDVAIERADSPRSRDMAKEVRTEIATLADGEIDTTQLKSQVVKIQQELERLSSRASGIGLKARDDIEGFSSQSDALLLLSIGTSIVLVLVALFLLDRLISQAQAARRQVARRDEEIMAATQQQSILREKELAAKSMQTAYMNEVLDRFMRDTTEPMEKLHTAAKDLNLSAERLSELAQHAKGQSVTVVSESEETAVMVQSAATVGEQLAQTIAEVKAHAFESSRLAAGAVSEVMQTNSTIDELAVVAKEISDVTDLISRIAGQTNLLALNATIEAARAGEAGRGFAIVAQEVKTLAGQTAKATRDISKRIEAIQSVTDRSVEAIQGISNTIKDLEQFSVRIAAAVEQQAQAAREIAGNLGAASANVVNVANAITNVESVGNQTAQAAEVLSSASVSVTDQTKKIHERVRAFAEEVRAAQTQ